MRRLGLQRTVIIPSTVGGAVSLWLLAATAAGTNHDALCYTPMRAFVLLVLMVGVITVITAALWLRMVAMTELARRALPELVEWGYQRGLSDHAKLAAQKHPNAPVIPLLPAGHPGRVNGKGRHHANATANGTG